MPSSKLNEAKDEFKQHIKRSSKLIQSVNKARPHFLQDQIYLIYELSFLRIFLAGEEFIESTFILYMLQEKTDSGYGPKTYVRPVDRRHAYKFAREGRDYTDWTSPDTVIRKAVLLFEDGKPFKDAFTPIIQDIQDMKTIRNAVVHMSTKSREKFETLVRNKLGYAKSGITPGEFLYTNTKSQDMSYITYFTKILEFASKKIVK